MPPMSEATRIALLEQADQHHAEAIDQMQGAIKVMSESLQSLVRLEERHAESKEAIARAFTTLKKQEERLAAIERAMPGVLETRRWVVAGVLAIVALVGIAAFRVIFYEDRSPPALTPTLNAPAPGRVRP